MKIGILGLGTVGVGVVNVLNKNKQSIKRRTGDTVEIVIASVKDINKSRDCDTSNIEITKDPFNVVNHPQVDVVIELIGGTDISKKLVKEAINNNKHVITANKALIAEYGNEIIKIAKAKKVKLLFEASVAGGIPIIKTLSQSLASNQINSVLGIINGTGNFILSEMKKKGVDFEKVLKEAQKLGYAEADPKFDIEGIDAAHKLCILSAIAFGTELQFSKVYTEGIEDITAEDIKYATELGFTIKNLGIAKKNADSIEMRVHPTLIPKNQLIANVDGVMNAVLVKSNALGQSLYYGAGAGAKATASAVIADLIDIMNKQTNQNILGWRAEETIPIIDADMIDSEFYMRLLVSDKQGVLAKITKIFSENNVSIERLVQKQVDSNNNAHIAIITNKIKNKNIQKVKKQIENCDFNKKSIKIIYIESTQ